MPLDPGLAKVLIEGLTIDVLAREIAEGHIWLLIAYAKAKFDNLPIAFLNQLKEEISNGS